MNKKSIQHFITNVICGFIYNKDERKRLRVVLNSPVLEYMKFIKRDTGFRRPRFRTFVGYQARSLIMGVNNKWVYKFPLRRDNYRELAMREKRIVDALAPLSPIHVPNVELLEWNHRLVRKYEFIRGKSMRRISPELVRQHIDALAAQVANFIYTIGQCDPAEIRDLKPAPDIKPGYMFGWCQGDIYDNFMVDTNTMRVVAFIDWEDAQFGDFAWRMTAERDPIAHEFMLAVRNKYDQIWNKNHPKKKQQKD
ncbi:hypothetical protein HDR66_02265 [bacterium]|nr:hypothetical protein [bacterium]